MKNESELIMRYLQGILSKQETDEFYSWVNESNDHKKLFFETKAVYDACARSPQSADMKASWIRLLNKRPKHASHLYHIGARLGSYAAVALIAVVLTSSFFLYFRKSDKSLACYLGGDGLKADIVRLPDGTEVSLGSKTTFYYEADYGRNNRIVHLEGEAYFDIAHQKDKPFIVKVKGQEIEALGTKFNVMAYPSDSLFTTTLLEGHVRLTTVGVPQSTTLLPDQQYVYNRNAKTIAVSQVDANQYTSWTTGYYYFPQQSLKSILYRLGHVYGIDFEIQSEKLNNRIFTGTFYRGQSIQNIMEIIHLSIPIKYKIDEHHVTISE